MSIDILTSGLQEDTAFEDDQAEKSGYRKMKPKVTWTNSVNLCGWNLLLRDSIWPCHENGIVLFKIIQHFYALCLVFLWLAPLFWLSWNVGSADSLLLDWMGAPHASIYRICTFCYSSIDFTPSFCLRTKQTLFSLCLGKVIKIGSKRVQSFWSSYN